MAAVAAASVLGSAPFESDGAASPPPLVEAAVPLPTPSHPLPALGAMVDVGLPDGAGASLVYRPLRFLRLSAGGMTNTVSAGLRAGVMLEPLHSFVRPSLSVEGGHYFPGNANGLAQSVSGNSGFNTSLLEKFSYDFANAHLGIEIGSSRRFSFFLHAGYSHVWMDLSNVDQQLQSSTNTTWTAQPVHVQLDTLSAKLGFVLFFG